MAHGPSCPGGRGIIPDGDDLSPAWAGAFFTTEPPGKPPFILGRGSLEFYNEIFRRIKKEPAFWSKTKTRNA